MSDNGNFTCQVFNKYGYINATFEVIVYGKHDFSAIAILTEPFKDVI